jgi:4-amino-4-deoxy-L-arabinose transferase-like glycosyltransferase
LILLAAVLRFWALGDAPPGLYRDEAYNGLDALEVLEGRHALFFPANNGREPLYIYLTAAAIALLGHSVLALRLAAAVISTLTVIPTYLLAREWFGRTTGLFAAALWAITFWPIHLGRIGLRVGLLAPLLALAFWLGTRAYRSQRPRLWFIAGLVYGLSFYTYLAARFTPLLLLLFAAYLWLTGRGTRLWAKRGPLWFALGTVVVIAPLGLLAIQQPDLFLGRSGQVSILSPAVNHGDLWGTLLGNIGRSLGLFFWRGDPILRHNALLDYETVLLPDDPAGRPVFDLLMAVPFLIGLVWCAFHWRHPAAAAVLLWQTVMLGPTLLAADAPHFLRAAGLLPAIVLLPALGLNTLWNLGARQHSQLTISLLPRAAVILLLLGSLATTTRDYRIYAQQPDVGYLFEKAATDLAHSITAELPETTVYVDGRFWSGWPSVRFLAGGRPLLPFTPPEDFPAVYPLPAAIYAWPYGPLDFVALTLPGEALITVEAGGLARGDLEETAYSLYTRYHVQAVPEMADQPANFDGQFLLRAVEARLVDDRTIEIDLQWEAAGGKRPTEPLPVAFVHLLGPAGLVAQSDRTIANGLWAAEWWRPGLVIGEQRRITLPEAFDPQQHRMVVGLYRPETLQRLPVINAQRRPVADEIEIEVIKP